MSPSLPAEILAENTLPFLGNRTYLHGTTLFETLRGHISNGGAITFKIGRKIESNRIRVYSVSDDLSKQKVEYAATLVCRSSEGVRNLAVEVLGPHNPIERQSYNESLISQRVVVSAGEVVFAGASPFSFVATLIPMFKVLLKREHPMSIPGQWMFTRMDLDLHPQNWEKLVLRLDAVLGNTLAKSVIMRNGTCCGHLYYSWVA